MGGACPVRGSHAGARLHHCRAPLPCALPLLRSCSSIIARPSSPVPRSLPALSLGPLSRPLSRLRADAAMASSRQSFSQPPHGPSVAPCFAARSTRRSLLPSAPWHAVSLATAKTGADLQPAAIVAGEQRRGQAKASHGWPGRGPRVGASSLQPAPAPLPRRRRQPHRPADDLRCRALL